MFVDGSVLIVYEMVFIFEDGGVVLGMYNFKEFIWDFVCVLFFYGFNVKWLVYLFIKNIIFKVYDGMFKDEFECVYEEEFKVQFEVVGLIYEYWLIDDMVVVCLKWEGGYVWVCKNYDGDVQLDIVVQGYGLLGLMMLVLMMVDGKIVEVEVVYGIVIWYYWQYQVGKLILINLIVLIFVWICGLQYCGKLDGIFEVIDFVYKLEFVVIVMVESGKMIKDFVIFIGLEQDWLNSEEFFDVIVDNLEKELVNQGEQM